jgi:NAD(P)-dependent dehydrogenase (short-subunit alcohol dehydrogenase family)
MEAAVKAALDKFGKIDILVNCAGIPGSEKPVIRMTDEDLDEVMSVDFRGTFLVSRAVAQIMVQQKSGKIINVSSILGKISARGMAGYCASKAAVLQLTRVMALELTRDNIQVNAVAPGAVNTQMLDEILAAGKKAGPEYHQTRQRAQAGGTPMELVCELVSFLASPASGALTGKLISAPHDPWREWAGRDRQINGTPLYTIRRLDPFTIKPLIEDLAKKI